MKQHWTKYLTIALLLSASMLFANPSYFLIIEQDSVELIDSKDLEVNLDNLLLNFGNKGYPHIEINFDSYVKKGNNEYFHYRVNKKEKVTIDTVVFGDYSPREVSLLSRYIDLPESGEFNYSKLINMIAELKNDPLLTVQDKADIYKNGLRLYTEAKQNIRFDAMAAYKEEVEAKGIIGNLSFELANLGGLGRMLSFHWSRPTLEANSIDLSYTEPYIFNRPFSASLAFAQRYEDSSYVKRDLDLSLIYHIDRRSTLSVNYLNEYIGSSENGSDSLFITRNRSASKITFNWYSKPGIFMAKIQASSSLHFAEEHRVSKNHLELETHYRANNIGANLRILGGYATSEEVLASYDQYKIGGARFLRGAYFEQYVSPAYLGWSLESGYFNDTDIFLFYDGAIIKDINKVQHHAGLGISIPAANSKLTIALGLDTREGFNGAKFHAVWGQQ